MAKGAPSLSMIDSPRVLELLERAGLEGLPPRTLKAVLLLGLLVLALGVWRFWPAAPQPEMPFDPIAAVPASEEASAPPPADIVVHVAGAVVRPGVYRLAAGSRVGDALGMAGGGIATAALDSLNLARILADGEQVYVLTSEQVAAGTGPPQAAPPRAGSPGAPSPGKVNINQATAAELEELPGVGPATAQKIVEDRETNGPFAAPEDLMRIPGIGAKKFESMRDFVVCG